MIQKPKQEKNVRKSLKEKPKKEVYKYEELKLNQENTNTPNIEKKEENKKN